MQTPRPRVSVHGPAASGLSFAADDGRGEQTDASHGAVPWPLILLLRRASRFIPTLVKGQPKNPLGTKPMPWVFIILGTLWYAIAWWALG